MSLAAGTRLGAYRIISPLGAGGMYEVSSSRNWVAATATRRVASAL